MLKESFDWAPPGMNEVPRGNLLKLVAKTEATTYHPTDPNYPVRRFNKEELIRAARTLVGRPVGRNHEPMPITGAYVLDSEFSDNRVESIAYAPSNFIDKVRSGKINRCSIEYTWRDEKIDRSVTPPAVEFLGLIFTRVDLLEGLDPGDNNAQVMLYEALDKANKTGALNVEVKLVEAVAVKTEVKTEVVMPIIAKKPLDETAIKLLGEPFAGYTNFADCIAKNSDKSDPNAYCAVIMRQAESENSKKSLSDITAGFKQLQTENTSLKADRDKAVSEAKQTAHEEMRRAVESILPNSDFLKDAKLNRFLRDVKGVINEPSK